MNKMMDAIIRPVKLEEVKFTLADSGLVSMTVVEVRDADSRKDSSSNDVDASTTSICSRRPESR